MASLKARLEEIVKSIQDKFGRQDAATNEKLKSVERVFLELAEHVKVLEAKAASGDPWSNPGPPAAPAPAGPTAAPGLPAAAPGLPAMPTWPTVDVGKGWEKGKGR